VSEPLQALSPQSIITGWDFSTGACKCLAFDLNGKTLAETRLPTKLVEDNGAVELDLDHLREQANLTTKSIAEQLRDSGRLKDWVASGISATHHTNGRIDAQARQVRRAICWNDQTLAAYHKIGLERLGGQDRARQLTGGPWAVRYSLSHLLKDAATLSRSDWERTWLTVSHGSLAAGYLTGNFQTASLSSAASTGLMDLKSGRWCEPMLNALEHPWQRELAAKQLPPILDQYTPIGSLLTASQVLVFPTSDDQQAGLVGGGAVDAGQVAIILGNSAVVNSSSNQLPATPDLDAMRLNWGPYLWMRCYTNGAQFLDNILGTNPDWGKLEAEGAKVAPGCDGTMVLPFLYSEPSVGVEAPRLQWLPSRPTEIGKVYRASLEALAYLIALGVRAHEKAGQKITRVTVSGGIARSDLMCTILASVLGRPLHRLVSSEGPALGAAVTALAAMESHQRKARGLTAPFTVTDAVAVLVKFRDEVQPNPAWRSAYEQGLDEFERHVASR